MPRSVIRRFGFGATVVANRPARSSHSLWVQDGGAGRSSKKRRAAFMGGLPAPFRLMPQRRAAPRSTRSCLRRQRPEQCARGPAHRTVPLISEKCARRRGCASAGARVARSGRSRLFRGACHAAGLVATRSRRCPSDGQLAIVLQPRATLAPDGAFPLRQELGGFAGSLVLEITRTRRDHVLRQDVLELL